MMTGYMSLQAVHKASYLLGVYIRELQDSDKHDEALKKKAEWVKFYEGLVQSQKETADLGMQIGLGGAGEPNDDLYRKVYDQFVVETYSNIDQPITPEFFAERWDEMSETQKAQLIERSRGKR